MNFSSFIKTTIGNIIYFKNDIPIKNVGSVKFYTDNANRGFLRKEFRWSPDKIQWSFWADLTIPNISKTPVSGNPSMYIEVRYTMSSPNPGAVTFFSIEYLPLTGPITPNEFKWIGTIINADTLDKKSPDFYLQRKNHKGNQNISTITGLEGSLSGMRSRFDYHMLSSSTGIGLYWNNGKLNVESSNEQWDISQDSSISKLRNHIDGSLNQIDLIIQDLDYSIKSIANIYIKNTYTSAEIKLAIESQLSDYMSIVFEPGEYVLDEYIYLYGFKELMINFNGAVIRSDQAGGGILSFCTNDSNADKYFRISGADSSWFVSDMSKGIHYIEVTDPVQWGTVNKGDMIIIGDERKVPGVLNSMGLLLIFNRFEEVNGVWRMIFDYPSRGDLQCKTNLKYVSSFGGGYMVCRVPLQGNVRAVNGTFENCQLMLQGFNSANVDKIVMRQTTYPFASDDQSAVGLNVTYCKDIHVNNFTASGFNQTGYGYGIISGAWDKMIISNYIAYNNKHSFTTSTTYYHYNNIVKYINSLFSSTIDQQNNDSTNGSPLDQHAGVWEVDADGLTIEGSRPAVHYRGVNNTLKNFNLHKCKIGITSDIGEVTGQSKDYLILDNWTCRDHQGPFFIHSSNVSLNSLEASHIFIDFSNADITKDVIAFSTADPTAYLKNLTIKDSKFIGRKRNSALSVREEFISISNDNNTAGFDNIVVRHTEIKNFRYILKSGLPKMTSVLFDDCDIEGFESLLATSNVTTAGTIGYNDVLFKNCRISIGYSLINMNSSKFMMNNVRFEDCKFNFIANNIVNMANNIINRLEFIDNKFRNSFYGVSGRFILFSGGGCNYMLEENNRFYKQSQTDIDAVILAQAETGYVETGVPKYTCMGPYVTKIGNYPTEYDQIDNIYYTDGWAEGFIRLAGGKGKNCGNKFFVSLIQTRFMELNGRNSAIYNNTLVLSNILANSEFIRSLTAGGVVNAVGNTIINNSSTGSIKLFNIADVSYYEGGTNKFNVNLSNSITNCTILGS